MSGYSYTTISMAPGQAPRVGVSIYPDDKAEIRYFPTTEDGSRAFIAIDHGPAHINIGLSNQTSVTDAHITFARNLVAAAVALLADCQRLKATDSNHTDDETDQADEPGKAVHAGETSAEDAA